MSQKKIITIVGAGMMGSAMTIPARDNGHSVRLVGTPLDEHIISRVRRDGYHPTLKEQLPDGVEFYSVADMAAAMSGADLIIGGVSSFGVDWFSQEVLPLLQPGQNVLSVTKGLQNYPDGRLGTFPALLAERLPATLRDRISFSAIGGPCTSYELARRRQTMVYFCGEDAAAVASAKEMLATAYYHITPTADVLGLECCVAMKNAYALGVSMAIGLWGGADECQGFNPQAALFGQSCREVTRLIRHLGADTDLVANLPFAGDLYVTIFGGRTRRLGTLLGQGKSMAEAEAMLSGVTLESVAITRRVAAALRAQAAAGKVQPADYPLLMHIDDVINDRCPAAIAWDTMR
ncbi:MAG: glycerol-3-phosphate dehydrogenase [Lentisphaerae bacterium]|nr:glycerol-3-phosphate dehydrogenase [Lentisphaerota bacterium]